MKNMLWNEMKRLQENYKTVLKTALNNINNASSVCVVDEINVFWYQNRHIVDLILTSLFEPNSAFVFTGATFLDVKDFEHYPFVALGKYHIFDDPLCAYVNMPITGTKEFDAKVKQQIISTIEDNISIINDYSKYIFILPIRRNNKDIRQLVSDGATQAFCSLFKNNIDVSAFFKLCKTGSDIHQALRDDIEKSIILWDDDNIEQDLQTRIDIYKKFNPLPKEIRNSDSKVFYFALFGYLSQALHIFIECSQYQMIPYIRYKVCFHYLMFMSQNFIDNNEIENMILKCVVAHITYNCFDKAKVENFKFCNYISVLESSNFYENIIKQINQEEVTIRKPFIKHIDVIVKNQLSVVYKMLEENKKI